MSTTATFTIEAAGPSTGARALVICPDIRKAMMDMPRRSADLRLEEAVGLAAAIQLDVVESFVVPLARPNPATLMGSGKVKEIQTRVDAHDIELVVIDGEVSPIQQRNLEKAWKVKVLDRTGLILEIFGARASTREGTLQVELAHLTYQKGRLVRTWTHLERQRGGLGFVGGPGETQIESDRRQIQDRINMLKKQLDKVSKTREVNRATRREVPFPIIALVGYTNAGKSTLFNRMTGSKVMAEDMLFATLDPTMRAIQLPSGHKVILSDTVGFISELPTQLIAAFRATLEEVLEAEVLIHVRDASSPTTEAERDDVLAVMDELGVGEEDPRVIIEVLNKSDLLNDDDVNYLANLAGRASDDAPVVLASALTGDGVETLLASIDEVLSRKRAIVDVRLGAGEGEAIAWLHRNADVLESESDDEGRMRLRVRVEPGDLGRFEKRFEGVKGVRVKAATE